ncbi:MAG: glycerol-3-phosphate acyltransferase [Candidatus Thorarchaeota archaeon]
MPAINILWILLAIILSYLIGSIPFSVWLGKLVKGYDLRNSHTGNPGGFNAVRTFGLAIGLPIMFLDFFKGTSIILIVDQFFSIDYFQSPDGTNIVHTVMCIVCPSIGILGHIFPIWLKFKGGQGLGIFIGVLFYINPLVMLAFFLMFIFFILVLKTAVRTSGTIIVNLCIPLALFLPIGPPWCFILNDWIFGGFLFVTQGLIVIVMNLALLTKLIGHIQKKTTTKEEILPEFGQKIPLESNDSVGSASRNR